MIRKNFKIYLCWKYLRVFCKMTNNNSIWLNTTQNHKKDLDAFKQFNIIAYKFSVPKYEAALFSDLNFYHTFFCTILIYMFTYFNRLNFNRRFHEHIYIFCKGCSKIQIFQSGTSHRYFSSLDDSILFS